MKFFGRQKKKKKFLYQNTIEREDIEQSRTQTQQLNDLMNKLEKQATKVKQTAKEHRDAKFALHDTLADIAKQNNADGDFDDSFFHQFNTTQTLEGHLMYDTQSNAQKLFSQNFREIREDSQKCESMQKNLRATVAYKVELAEKVHTLSKNKHRDRATKKLLIAQQELLVVSRKLGKNEGKEMIRMCSNVCFVLDVYCN